MYIFAWIICEIVYYLWSTKIVSSDLSINEMWWAMLEIECGVPIKPGAENRGSLLQPKELPSTRYTQSNEACKICLPKNPVTYPLDTYIENI